MQTSDSGKFIHTFLFRLVFLLRLNTISINMVLWLSTTPISLLYGENSRLLILTSYSIYEHSVWVCACSRGGVCRMGRRGAGNRRDEQGFIGEELLKSYYNGFHYILIASWKTRIASTWSWTDLGQPMSIYSLFWDFLWNLKYYNQGIFQISLYLQKCKEVSILCLYQYLNIKIVAYVKHSNTQIL